jgi:hypothetical protein
MDDSGIPQLIMPFQPQEEPLGEPIFVPDGSGGTTILVLVVTDGLQTGEQEYLLACESSCSYRTTLPYIGNDQLAASPTVAVDHTIFAVQGASLILVSHDEGYTFKPVARAPVQTLHVIPTPQGRRFIAVSSTDGSVAFSDDDGVSWRKVAIDPRLGVINDTAVVGVLGSGRLITAFERKTVLVSFGFACSPDGSSWGACGSLDSQ